jgi:hypothetical protein
MTVEGKSMSEKEESSARRGGDVLGVLGAGDEMDPGVMDDGVETMAAVCWHRAAHRDQHSNFLQTPNKIPAGFVRH